MKDTKAMAREAGIDEWWDSGSDWRETFNERLKAFETLVRADEREECAKVVENTPVGMFSCDMNGSAVDGYVAQWKAAVSIRARGETEIKEKNT
jgi:hypothetical protein